MRKYISLAATAVLGLLIFAACQQSPPALKTEIGADGVARISAAEAKRAFDRGNVVFIDTRGDFIYKQEHIKGALNIPAESFQTRFAEAPRDKTIITYCS